MVSPQLLIVISQEILPELVLTKEQICFRDETVQTLLLCKERKSSASQREDCGYTDEDKPLRTVMCERPRANITLYPRHDCFIAF